MIDSRLLRVLAPLPGLWAFIWVVFARAEKVASPALKWRVAAWLKSADPARVVAGWPPTFVEVFDLVFGEKHLSWRCFGRSCLASVGAVLVVTVYWAALRPREVLAALRGSQAANTALSYFILTLLLSLWPDYVSLLKSRRLIGWMNRRPRILRLLAGLAFDLSATIILVGFSWYIYLLLKFIVLYGGVYSVGLIFRLPLYLTVVAMWGSYSLSAAPGFPPEGIWPWATLFTTAWATLYAVAGGLLILARYMGIGLSAARWGLDIDTKPIMSLGVVAMGVVTAAYVIMALAFWAVKG